MTDMRRDELDDCGCLSRYGIAAAGCSSMVAGSMRGENYCGIYCGNHVWPC